MAFFGARELRRRKPPVYEQPVYMPGAPPTMLPAVGQPQFLVSPPDERSNGRVFAVVAIVMVIGLGAVVGLFATGVMRLDQSVGAPGGAQPVPHSSTEAKVSTSTLPREKDAPTTAPGTADGTPPSSEDTAHAEASTPAVMTTVPKAFRGRWDNDISDGCDGREATFTITPAGDVVYTYEVENTVMKVEVHSPTQADVSVAGYGEDGKRYDETYRLQLGAKGLTLRAEGGTQLLRRCPA